jgi:RNA polymerase sigma factor (sigma-70 family)
MSALLGVSRTAAPPAANPAERTRDLYERYGQRVFTFCYSRLREREAAQDAAQTTFIYVLRALQRGVVPEFELAWLLKIAFNVCRGARRSAGRETAVTQDVEDIDGLAAPVVAGPEAHERLEALRDGLAELPETQRRGILLREWQGLSYAEIADELGVSVGAVETLLFRARRNLAARLQHVRSAVGALDIASLAAVCRSVFRGSLLKVGLVGAGASMALVPVISAEVSPALAERGANVSVAPLTPLAAPKPGSAPAQTWHRAASGAVVLGRLRLAWSAGPVRPRAERRRIPEDPPLASPRPNAVSATAPAETPSPSSVPGPPQRAEPPAAPAPPPVRTPTALQVPSVLPPLDANAVGTVVKTVDPLGVTVP